jgi:hypothetical protein
MLATVRKPSSGAPRPSGVSHGRHDLQPRLDRAAALHGPQRADGYSPRLGAVRSLSSASRKAIVEAPRDSVIR